MALIDSFNLRAVYNFSGKNKKYFIEDVLLALDKKLSFSSSDLGTVSIAILDTSPKQAASMANFAARMVDSINKDIIRTHLGKKKEFLRQRMLDNRESLHQYEDSLLAFQKEKGIIDIQQQAIASIQAIGEAETKLLLEEMQLSMEQNKLSGESPHLQERLADLKLMHDKLSKVGSEKNNSVLLSVAKIPSEALTFVRMGRSVAIMDFLDKYLTKEYETSCLEERSTVPTIAILDSARVPEKKAKPKRRQIAFIFMLVGLSLGAVGSVVFESFFLYRNSLPQGGLFTALVDFAAFAGGKKR
jgi:capsule polysaccharide export protein KpsE/RkpR